MEIAAITVPGGRDLGRCLVLVLGPVVDGGLAGAYQGGDDGVASVGREGDQSLPQLVGGEFAPLEG